MSDMSVSLTFNRRILTYLGTGAGLCLLYIFLRDIAWQGNSSLHIVMESLATLLALVVGAMALVRYFSRKDSIYLIVGVGFIGTGSLDGFHAIVSASLFQSFMPSDLQALIPWSWFASRLFLSVMMLVSWGDWYLASKKTGGRGFGGRTIVSGAVLFTLACVLYFVLVPLPTGYIEGAAISRPWELIPGLCFLLALIGYLKKGQWRDDPFENWLVLSLIAGLVCQAVLMPIAGQLFGLENETGHVVKALGYVFVLVGLFGSTFVAHREAEAKSEYVRSIIENTAEGIITIDLAGHIETFNPAAENIFGYEAVEVVGKNVDILLPESERAAHNKYVENSTLHAPRIINQSRDLEGMRRSGERFPVELNVARMFAGKTAQFVGIFRDITERVGSERALVTAKEDAEVAAKAKSEFLANMSHEIRTPMNGVIGMLDLLGGTDLTDDQIHYLNMATNSAEMQLNVINDILDFSKVDSGLLDLEEVYFEPSNIVEEVTSILAEQAQSKGVEIASFIAPSVPKAITGDPTRLRQILANLINNAVKFTSTGEVITSVSKERDSDGIVTLRFEVKDTGIGISDEAVKELFKSFVQADSSTTRNFGGTGLGLAISRQLTLLMGGEIGVESKVGVGSTFWISVPFGKTEPKTVATTEQLNDMSVLIVDDNDTNREILEKYFVVWGIRQASAASGPVALDMLRLAEGSKKPFDAVVLDYNMPGMDGLDVAQAIQRSDDISPLKIILLSSSQPPDVAVTRAAGITTRLNKPVRQSSLMSALANMDEVPGALDVVGPGRALISGKQKFDARVLLVEDTFINRQVAIGILGILGITPEEAHNGREAVNKVTEGDFDLILMDIQMPEMDGLEATKLIREREEQQNLPKTPIVAMTAHALEGDREKCLAAGMDDYLAKPVRQPDLFKVLQNWLKAEETDEPGGTNGSQADGGDDTLAAQGSILDDATFQALKGSLDAIPNGLNRVLKDFLETTPAYLKTIREALESGNAEMAFRPAHSLKSNCSTIGVLALSELAREIEQIVGKDSFDGVEGLLAKAEALAEQARVHLQGILDS
jgi:PAS domain S-box-containing protein